MSPNHHLPFAFQKGGSMPETTPPGDSGSSQQATYSPPTLSGVGAQFPHEGQFPSMYDSAPVPLSGQEQVPPSMPVEHQETHTGYQQREMTMIREEQSGHAMATMQSLQGATNFYSPSYLDHVDAETRYASGFVQFSQPGSFGRQEPAGTLHSSIAPTAIASSLPHHGGARAFTSTQGRREAPWTERHTNVLRQGKRAGKSVPAIVRDLYHIDGVERTPNMVSKRWGKIRGGCVKKHEMDAILHAVCPEMVDKVYGELSNLDIARAPDFCGQLAASENRARDILRHHVAKGVQEVVLKLFSNDVLHAE
ncbi:hypothetical protein B0H65DRAFT_549309 [Neurospora tetraspora]|uniref:Uncharacterized protein n=1 Tax=Neurospora tetraspora TaxID=94610 RepID=A0AAE0JG00_9PEZI|nr:hypothetical protein B0H65DRAFT_549309 [Neurospora tetraspora]